jgi:hypothetical protein
MNRNVERLSDRLGAISLVLRRHRPGVFAAPYGVRPMSRSGRNDYFAGILARGTPVLTFQIGLLGDWERKVG